MPCEGTGWCLQLLAKLLLQRIGDEGNIDLRSEKDTFSVFGAPDKHERNNGRERIVVQYRPLLTATFGGRRKVGDTQRHCICLPESTSRRKAAWQERYFLKTPIWDLASKKAKATEKAKEELPQPYEIVTVS